MHAIQISEYGDASTLVLNELPTPEPGSGEVRVAVAAAAVNPVDQAIREGYLDAITQGRFPIGFGWDVAGAVDAVGEGVTTLSPGDAVVAAISAMGVTTGGYATHVVVPAADVALAPTTVDAVHAATLPMNALTASQALDLTGLEAGQTLLVTGAAGAVGAYAVTLAAQRGLTVIGLARAADEADVLQAGATKHVTDLDGVTADAVFDAAVLREPALAAVEDGGTYVGVQPGSPLDAVRGIAVTNVMVKPDGARLAELVAEVDAGRIRLRVAGTYPLSQAGEAQDAFAKGGVRGRFVLVP